MLFFGISDGPRSVPDAPRCSLYLFQISPGSIRYRSRIDRRSIRDRSLIDPGSIHDRSWIDPRSILDRCRIDLGSIQDPGSILDRAKIDSGSIRDRSCGDRLDSRHVSGEIPISASEMSCGPPPSLTPREKSPAACPSNHYYLLAFCVRE